MYNIKGEDLARVVGNVMKFSNPKSLYLPGEILFDLTQDRLTCYSSDDYMAITDSAPIESDGEFYFVLDLEDVKKLEKFARDNKKYRIKINKINDSLIDFDSDDESCGVFELKEYREEAWDIVEMILFDKENIDNEEVHLFDIRPERLTKLSQLKHDKDAPLAAKFVSINGFILLRFKIGDTLRGVFRPVDRSAVDPRYLWE